MNRAVNNMKRLINIKFYPTAEKAYEIADAFLMADRISVDEYTDLSILIEETYNPPTPEAVPDEPAPPINSPVEVSPEVQ